MSGLVLLPAAGRLAATAVGDDEDDEGSTSEAEEHEEGSEKDGEEEEEQEAGEREDLRGMERVAVRARRLSLAVGTSTPASVPLVNGDKGKRRNVKMQEPPAVLSRTVLKEVQPGASTVVDVKGKGKAFEAVALESSEEEEDDEEEEESGEEEERRYGDGPFTQERPARDDDVPTPPSPPPPPPPPVLVKARPKPTPAPAPPKPRPALPPPAKAAPVAKKMVEETVLGVSKEHVAKPVKALSVLPEEPRTLHSVIFIFILS